MDKQVYSFKETIGINNEILKSHIRQITKKPYCAWVSGSLVEGLGNKASDIDVYVIDERSNFKKSPTKNNNDHAIFVVFEGGRRFDYEVWPIESVKMLAEKLNEIPLNKDENTLDILNEGEIDFIHRVEIGIPILNNKSYSEIKKYFNKTKFQDYLKNNKLLYLDDSFEDAVGMFMDGDYKLSSLRCRNVVEYSIDYLLLLYGCRVIKEKYREKIFRNFINKNDKIKNIYDRYWEYISSIPQDEENQKYYARKCFQFSNAIVDFANKLEFDKDASLDDFL